MRKATQRMHCSFMAWIRVGTFPRRPCRRVYRASSCSMSMPSSVFRTKSPAWHRVRALAPVFMGGSNGITRKPLRPRILGLWIRRWGFLSHCPRSPISRWRTFPPNRSLKWLRRSTRRPWMQERSTGFLAPSVAKRNTGILAYSPFLPGEEPMSCSRPRMRWC